MNVHHTSVDIQASEHEMANAIRALTMDAVQRANSGHPGMPLGMADVATVLFNRFIRIDPTTPNWPDRDRFILSAGHGSMLQYAIHHLVGYADMPIAALAQFRQLGSVTAGHPEYGHTFGVETTTGPLGQGLATAVGMALAERMLTSRYGKRLVNHKTYVIAGDGCLQEGISHEAIDLAGHLKLSQLIVLWDDNRISIDGDLSLSTSMRQRMRFAAAGWATDQVDGHDHGAIAAALTRAQKNRRPTMIACRTVIGKGAPNLQGSEKVHGAPLGDAEIAAARVCLSWPFEAFHVPESVYLAWQGVAQRGRQAREDWERRLELSSRKDRFLADMKGNVPPGVTRALSAFRRKQVEKKVKLASRKASENTLAIINAKTTLTVGGSADLTHSNLTLTPGLLPIRPGDFQGRYIHFGIREHAMAAAMNGMALHGGFIPYGGTFLCFADYARGAIRLSALMRQRVIYVMTHDSIGLGEDGPTHQPVEHLAMLRATPDLQVFRPADAVETVEAWELALTSRDRPTVLVLSRQALPMLRNLHTRQNQSARGAYVLRDTVEPRQLTLLATGSELQIAVAAAERLSAERALNVAVISMPSWDRFEAQDDAYKRSVLGTAPRIAIEAAARLGWDRWLGETGRFIGMTGFGASAPAEALYEHFGITVEAVVKAADALLSNGACHVGDA